MEEAEGLRLHLSSGSATGYLAVYENASGRFEPKHSVDGMADVHARLWQALE